MTTIEASSPASPPPAVVDGTVLPTVEPSRRREVTFRSGGETLVGHWYPAHASEVAGTLVMDGPMTSVKEETLPHYAVPLSDAGYQVLTFDHRNFGASGGTPRCRLDTAEQVEDLKNAVSYALTREEVDPRRLALATVCLGAGYALEVAAFDPRVKAVAMVAGGYDLTDTFWELFGREGFAAYLVTLNEARQRSFVAGDPEYLPAVAPGPDYGPSSMPVREAYEYYSAAQQREAPSWENRLTVDSMESLLAWNVVAHARQVTQPAIVVHGTTDVLLPPQYAQQVYDGLSGPKELVWIDTHNHVELYDQAPYVPRAVEAMVAFLARHLS
jgi:fermentation-respiration switch protein FrsA (DUF1100 family)